MNGNGPTNRGEMPPGQAQRKGKAETPSNRDIDAFILGVYRAALEDQENKDQEPYSDSQQGSRVQRQTSIYEERQETVRRGGAHLAGSQGLETAQPRQRQGGRKAAKPQAGQTYRQEKTPRQPQLQTGRTARRGGDTQQTPAQARAAYKGQPAGARQAAGTQARAAGKPVGAPKKRKRRLRTAGLTLMLLCGLYCIAVFSDIPFIKKWRDIYIETAMGTMTHQWLATAFIPGFVIDEVMGTRTDIEGSQNDIDTDWSVGSLSGADQKLKWNKLKKRFFDIYTEIDEQSFRDFMDAHGDEYVNGDGYLVIDESGLDQDGTAIKTTSGDQVLAIDTENGITIVRVEGEGYVGRLAIVKNPEQVGLGLSLNFGKSGSIIADIAESSDAVLAINASGFYDPGGHGNGGTPHGLVIKDGELLSGWIGNNNKAIGFDSSDQLNIEQYREDNDFRDAVEFKPLLVLDGEKAISGSAGWGIQPRSAIGQRQDGQVLLLVVDGRQPGYSIGCTMGDLADIMVRYGAEQACNLDGGSSSIMYFHGRKITQPSAGDKENGRLLPNAFIVTER